MQPLTAYLDNPTTQSLCLQYGAYLQNLPLHIRLGLASAAMRALYDSCFEEMMGDVEIEICEGDYPPDIKEFCELLTGLSECPPHEIAAFVQGILGGIAPYEYTNTPQISLESLHLVEDLMEV